MDEWLIQKMLYDLRGKKTHSISFPFLQQERLVLSWSGATFPGPHYFGIHKYTSLKSYRETDIVYKVACADAVHQIKAIAKIENKQEVMIMYLQV